MTPERQFSQEHVENRHAKLRRAVKPCGRIRIHRRVVHHALDILVAALQRMIEKDRMAATLLEQPFYGVCCKLC